MSIAITPRVGVHTRRSDAKLQEENNLLLIMPDGTDGCSLPETDARQRLQQGGMILSRRAHGNGRRALWTLTDIGRQRVAALRKRTTAPQPPAGAPATMERNDG